MKVLTILSACLLAYAVTAQQEVTDISGSLIKAGGVSGNVVKLLDKTSNLPAAMSVFTGVFYFIGNLLGDNDTWKRAEDRMKELVAKEVADYHDVLANSFISNIKNSLNLYNRYPEKQAGKPNKQKIDQGISLSEDINSGKMWVNSEVGKNPHTMLTYFMEVVSIDVALLYSMAAVYGKGDRNAWIRLEQRLKNHIEDAEKAAKGVLSWKMQSGHFKCETATCNSGKYEACGIRNQSRCAVRTTCATGKDLTQPMEKTVSYKKRPTGTGYRKINDFYSKTAKNTSSCNWFVNEIKTKANLWLKKNVYDVVAYWKQLKSRASRTLGR